jgi:hypothetical protein
MYYQLVITPKKEYLRIFIFRWVKYLHFHIAKAKGVPLVTAALEPYPCAFGPAGWLDGPRPDRTRGPRGELPAASRVAAICIQCVSQ